jgi:hypothetical protein
MSQIPKATHMETQTMEEKNINPIIYDPSLHYSTPKSELDIPLYVALRMTYPSQLDKYKTKAEKYGYYVDTKLTDNEHLILVNPKKNINKLITVARTGRFMNISVNFILAYLYRICIINNLNNFNPCFMLGELF